jgi:GcrA cell cycle regulator
MATFIPLGDPGREEIPPRFRADLRRRQPPATAADEFRATLGALGLTQHHVAKLFGVSPRNVRRWQYGDRRVPCGVGIVLRLLATGTVTVTQVEQAVAAVPIPAQTNGGANLKPSAPPLIALAPEPSALASAKATTLAERSLSTAEKVVALTPEMCRWPYGDPGRAEFFFCGSPVAKRPYCEIHRALAYRVPPAGRGHGVRVGFVAHGCQPAPAQGRPSIPGAFSATGASHPPKILLDRTGDLPGSAPPPA